MRSLNTSLPASTSNPPSQPPEQLLQAFKTAALSVTNLYKTAASDQANARHVGYQEALEDLLAFLDRERLGTDGGEAAKIRSWVTDRIDGSGQQPTGDSDDERGDVDKRTRSSSPAVMRKGSPDAAQPQTQPRQQSPPQSQTPAPTTTTSTNATTEPGPGTRQPNFTFTAEPQYPGSRHEDVDAPSSDVTGSSSPGNPHFTPTPNTTTSPSVRVELIPRAPRTPHRPNNGSRHGSRQSTRDPLAGAGSKRKFHFGDFFDISNFGNGRDNFGGGKRGRFT